MVYEYDPRRDLIYGERLPNPIEELLSGDVSAGRAFNDGNGNCSKSAVGSSDNRSGIYIGMRLNNRANSNSVYLEPSSQNHVVVSSLDPDESVFVDMGKILGVDPFA